MKTPHPLSKQLALGAFTLVEMLAVMGVMVVMVVLITPSAIEVLKGSGMTQSGEIVSDQIVLARQAALTSSHRVQVRLYELPVSSASATWNFCAIQSFIVPDNPSVAPTAVTNLQLLRPGIIFAPGSAGGGNVYSTLTPPLGSPPNYVPQQGTWTVYGSTQIPAYNNAQNPSNLPCYYVGFNFLPNGSTDLDPTSTTGWFVTLVDGNLPLPVNKEPQNFYTIRVDPILGHTEVFRP